MPVPKRKRSRSRRDKRFANKGIKARVFAACGNCKETVQPHAVCKSCGHYKGRKVLTTKTERSVARGDVRKAKEAKVAKAQEAMQQAGPMEVEPEEKK